MKSSKLISILGYSWYNHFDYPESSAFEPFIGIYHNKINYRGFRIILKYK